VGEQAFRDAVESLSPALMRIAYAFSRDPAAAFQRGEAKLADVVMVARAARQPVEICPLPGGSSLLTLR